MNKLLPIIFLLFSNSSNAKWIYTVTHVNGIMYWYEDASIQMNGEWRHVWVRARYPNDSKILNNFGARSSLYYYKINCSEYSLQIMERYFFSDENWTTKTNTNSTPTDRQHILPSSIHEYIANLFCRN